MGKAHDRKRREKSGKASVVSKAMAYSLNSENHSINPLEDTVDTCSSSSEVIGLFYYDRGNKGSNTTPSRRLEDASTQDTETPENQGSDNNDHNSGPNDTSDMNSSSTSFPKRSTIATIHQTDEEEEEEFARLVQEYNLLMNAPEWHKDLEWVLDENAARILQERKATDPQYRDMGQEEFAKVINFSEIYGRKNRREKPRKERDHSPSLRLNSREGTSDRRSARETELNFKQLNRDIKEFVRNEDMGETLELDAYNPMIRKLVHELAHFYGLDTRSEGSGAERRNVLTKGQNTRLPRDLKKLDRFIDSAQKAVKYSAKPFTKKTPVKPGLVQSSTLKIHSGSVVGGEASPITDDNVGNKLLRKLGWQPGQGLGSQKVGIKEPIAAVFKGNRTGLGS